MLLSTLMLCLGSGLLGLLIRNFGPLNPGLAQAE